MPNRRITDLTESTLSTSSYYMAVYDPNEVADIQPDGYIDYNKKIALKNFANLPSQSALTWYGTGADGDFLSTASVSYTTTNDQEVLVKNYKNFTLNVGHTVTVSNRCKGLLIYIGGDCVINGTLTMTGKGANSIGSVAHYVYQAKGFMGSYIPMLFFPTSSLSGFIPIYPSGGGGGAAGANGTAALYGQTGGGGGGYLGSAGSSGSSWSGGSGGGSGPSSTAGALYGGAGGNAVTANYGGGAGNPGGTSGGGTGTAGGNGTGGFIMLVVKGSFTIGSTGIISANGVSGGTGTAGGGGGSGGGRVIVLYTRSFINNGSITVNGGAGGGTAPVNGGTGGAGSITLREVSIF